MIKNSSGQDNGLPSRPVPPLNEGAEQSSLRDRAHLFDLIIGAPSYISFFTGENGQGASLRETMMVKRDHNDNVLYNMAMRKAKKLGASSWCVFKPVGVSHNVEYGRYGDESRLDFIETVSDLVLDDSDAKLWQANPPKSAELSSEETDNA